MEKPDRRTHMEELKPVAGHWNTEAGAKVAADYATKARTDLCLGHLSDMEVANGVYMASRNDLDLIVWQTAAKERIRWLSAQLAANTRASDKDELAERDAMQARVQKAVPPRPYPHWNGYGGVSEYFGFDGGSLTIRTVGDKAGTGWLCFAEDELEWEQDQESSKDYRICNLPNSELIAIRDKLNEVFPAEPAPDPDLVLAREAAAQDAKAKGSHALAAQIRTGDADDTIGVRSALRALKLKGERHD
jgi:hypothetical protein